MSDMSDRFDEPSDDDRRMDPDHGRTSRGPGSGHVLNANGAYRRYSHTPRGTTYGYDVARFVEGSRLEGDPIDRAATAVSRFRRAHG
jgi:hypothetical protein